MGGFDEQHFPFILCPLLADGVIGNTAVFGTAIQGSSPCRPTNPLPLDPELKCLLAIKIL